MQFTPAYPTPDHARAAEVISEYFSRESAVDTVLLVGSCARGKASPGSCLDIAVLAHPQILSAERKRLEGGWGQHYAAEPVYAAMRHHGPFAHIDLDFIDGAFDPQRHYHGWTSGADEFELEVGNTLAYSVPLGEGGPYYQELCAQWLPYYSEELRQQRLEMVLKFCRNNLEHIPLYAPRGLYFQSFKRFYHAFEEFQQALYISRRTYPIAYDKWVEEGVAEILGLPDLYARLPRLFEIANFESQEIVSKASQLNELIGHYMEQ
jgi:predicted nucleotidyltransferase